ncbi:hypothetical protein [Chryseobacterium indoltheticum]
MGILSLQDLAAWKIAEENFLKESQTISGIKTSCRLRFIRKPYRIRRLLV